MVADAPATTRRRFDPRELAAAIATPLVAIGLAIALGAAAILIAGEDVLTAYSELVRGAIGTPQNLSATIVRSIPIVVAGIGIGLAFRAGALNLGAEGQMILGGLAAAVVALALPGVPFPLATLIALVAGLVGGAAWVFLPGLLDVRLGVPLLITSLLLNYVGALFAAWVVTYPLRDVAAGGIAQTAVIPDAAWLPGLPGTRLNLGVAAIVILPFVVRWFLARTVAGYEFRMVGHNRAFAGYGGIDAGRRVLAATLLSGAICGLAGALVVLGVNHRYIDGVFTTVRLGVVGVHGRDPDRRQSRGDAVRRAVPRRSGGGRRRDGPDDRRAAPAGRRRPGDDHPRRRHPRGDQALGPARPGRRERLMDALFTVLDVALLASTIRLVSPILLAALGGILSERVGIFNVGARGADARRRVLRGRGHVLDRQPVGGAGDGGAGRGGAVDHLRHRRRRPGRRRDRGRARASTCSLSG